MAFDFSLTQESFTPIRPQKIEQLFASTNSPNRMINDITYRIQVPSTNNLQQTYGADEFSIGLEPIADQGKFPRQSTGLKRPPLNSTHNETVASNFLQDTTNYQVDAIPQFKPFYQIKESHPIRAACFHPMGDVFVVGSNSKTLRICKYPSEEELQEFTEEHPPTDPQVLFKFLQIHRGSVYCVAFNNQGNLLATGSNDQTVHVIKYNSDKHLPEGNEYKLTAYTGTIRDLCFIGTASNEDRSCSSILLSAGAGEFGIHMTDCNTMKTMQVLPGHESTIMSLNSWDQSGTFVSGSLDGTIRLWDVRSRKCISKIGTNQHSGGSSASKQNGDGCGSPVEVVRVEKTGKLLVSGHKDGNCMLYDIRGSRIVQLFKAHEDEIRTLNFSPKSYYLLTGSYDHKVKLMDLQGDLTGPLPSVDITQLNGKVVQTAWHPDDYSFVTTSADGSATLWTMPEMGSCSNKADL